MALTDTASQTKTDTSRGRRLLDGLDVSAKLLGAIAVVWVANSANNFQGNLNKSTRESQERLTGLTLQSQREQAASSLRAAMFSSLIQPFAGPQKDAEIPVDREQLLAELLVLNFSEDFESKPLLERVDLRLAAHPPGKSEGVNVSEPPREALRSIARRVADRQISSLAWDSTPATGGERGCAIYWLNVNARAEAAPAPNDGACTIDTTLGQRVAVQSPDRKSTLEIWVLEPNWDNETVKLSINARSMVPGDKNQRSDTISYGFTLTWFDLPLTDNTILPNGNRFAVNLRAISKDQGGLSLRVIWFPDRFFTSREHPLGYRQILDYLGPTTGAQNSPPGSQPAGGANGGK